MSLYNMVRGFNPNAEICLAMLGLYGDNGARIPRFRDAWLSNDGTQIVVLTRSGGGNRDGYAAENQNMANVSGFISDEDDDCDSTFARFTYRTPEQYQADTRIVAELMTLVGKGAERQGPGSMMDTLDPSKKPIPSIEKTDPRVDAGWQAILRIAKAAGLPTPE